MTAGDPLLPVGIIPVTDWMCVNFPQIVNKIPASCLVTATAFAFASCGQGDHEQELLTNIEKWETAAISAYKLDMQQGCFCPDFITRPIHLVVENGESTLTYKDDGSNVPEEASESRFIGTVPKMFDGIRFMIDSDPDELIVVYNEKLGFPERIGADPISSAIDDEVGFWVSDFEVIND